MSRNYYDLKGPAGRVLEGLTKKAHTVVRYHMIGCHFCELMQSEWNKFKDMMKDQRNIIVVDVERSALDFIPDHLKQNVSGFPTIISYARGGVKRRVYEGERIAENLKGWASALYRADLMKPARRATRRATRKAVRRAKRRVTAYKKKRRTKGKSYRRRRV